jgi:hypothetical protein
MENGNNSTYIQADGYRNEGNLITGIKDNSQKYSLPIIAKCEGEAGCYIPFKSPTSLLVVGSSFSGKTHFISNLVLNKSKMFYPEPKKILWVYNTWQNVYDTLSQLVHGIEFTNKIPSKSEIEKFTDDNQPCCLVIDDHMTNLDSAPAIAEYFTVFCHHRQLSIILVLQNLFHQCKPLRDISLNAQGIILFKNLRSHHQIGVLASQMFPGNKRKYFLQAYNDAVLNKPYGYLLLEINNQSDPKYRLRTNIFNFEQCIIYLPISGDDHY